MNTYLIFAFVPVLLATICMLITGKTMPSLFKGIAAGVIIYVFENGLSVHTLKNVLDTAVFTVTDNISVLAAISLLLLLVYLITQSTVITALNKATERYMYTPARLIAFMLIFAALFSLDDSLVCMALGSLLTGTALANGFTRERLAYLVNLAAVIMCCTSPFSSWRPVIVGSLTGAGLSEDSVSSILPFNFAALICLMLIFLIGLSVKQPAGKMLKPSSSGNGSTIFNREMAAFAATFAVLIIMMVVLTACCVPYALILSALGSLTVALLSFRATKAITWDGVRKAFTDAVRTSADLGFLLLTIWFLANVSNSLLGLGVSLCEWTMSINFPFMLMPAAVFALAGAFTFFTGSAFGTFGMYIPLAVNLSAYASPMVRTLTIAAAISGALMTSGSLSSDSLKVSAQSTESDSKKLQELELPYTLALYLMGLVSFLLAGLLAEYIGNLVMVIPFIVSGVYLLAGRFAGRRSESR